MMFWWNSQELQNENQFTTLFGELVEDGWLTAFDGVELTNGLRELLEDGLIREYSHKEIGDDLVSTFNGRLKNILLKNRQLYNFMFESEIEYYQSLGKSDVELTEREITNKLNNMSSDTPKGRVEIDNLQQMNFLGTSKGQQNESIKVSKDGNKFEDIEGLLSIRFNVLGQFLEDVEELFLSIFV